MALPADGSPMLEEHPYNGMEHGKEWFNEIDMVSEDHGDELRYSSLDFSTSSSEDKVSNEDQDDFKSRFRVVQLHPDIKFLSDMGELVESFKLLSLTDHQLCSADSRLTVVDVASQLLEIPSSFKLTSGLGKQQEPILRPEKSRPIATLQRHQVGLVENRASSTSRRARRISNIVYAAKEEDAPLQLSFGTVLPSSFKFTSELDEQEEPILRPEDSSVVSISPQPLCGWKNLVASLTLGRDRRSTKKVDTAKEDGPSSKPSHQVGLKEDAAHVTSVTGKNRKRTKDSDTEEQTPAKRTRDSVVKEELPAKRTSIGLSDLFSAFRPRPLAEKDLPAKRTRDSVAEEETPAKRTKCSDDASWDEFL